MTIKQAVDNLQRQYTRRIFDVDGIKQLLRNGRKHGLTTECAFDTIDKLYYELRL